MEPLLGAFGTMGLSLDLVCNAGSRNTLGTAILPLIQSTAWLKTTSYVLNKRYLLYAASLSTPIKHSRRALSLSTPLKHLIHPYPQY